MKHAVLIPQDIAPWNEAARELHEQLNVHAKLAQTTKQAGDNARILFDLSRRIEQLKEPLCTEHRIYIRHGLLDKLSPRGQLQERMFFLFNDVMMWAKAKGSKFTYKGHFMLRECKVRTMEPSLARKYRKHAFVR